MTTDFRIRPYHAADAPAVVDLLNAAALHTLGVPRAVVDGVGNIRLLRYVPPASEKVVVIDPQQTLVGYAYYTASDQHIIHEMGGGVHPTYWGQGIGTRLIQWAEERARVASQSAPAGVKTLLQTNLFASETAASQLFSAAGFGKVREWVHLAVALTTPPASATLPEGMTVRLMDLDNDWELVGPAMDAAFANHWGAITLPEAAEGEDESTETGAAEEPPTDDSYSNAPGFCFIVLDGGTVVGGILCNAKLVDQPKSGRVGSLFVHPHYQRQGIGRALLLIAFQAFWQQGVRHIILDTDAASFSETPKFYGSLGLRPYRHEFLWEKTVRPGREVRRLSL